MVLIINDKTCLKKLHVRKERKTRSPKNPLKVCNQKVGVDNRSVRFVVWVKYFVSPGDKFFFYHFHHFPKNSFINFGGCLCGILISLYSTSVVRRTMFFVLGICPIISGSVFVLMVPHPETRSAILITKKDRVDFFHLAPPWCAVYMYMGKPKTLLPLLYTIFRISQPRVSLPVGRTTTGSRFLKVGV